MSNWFIIAEGQGGSSTFIEAKPGNIFNVRRAYGDFAGRMGVKDARGYLRGITKIAGIFAERGLFGKVASPDGRVLFINKKPTKLDLITAPQLFSIFASFQLAIKKTYDDVLIANIDLLNAATEKHLVFNCNDPGVAFEVLWHVMRCFIVRPGIPQALPPDNYEELHEHLANALRRQPAMLPAEDPVREAA